MIYVLGMIEIILYLILLIIDIKNKEKIETKLNIYEQSYEEKVVEDSLRREGL